MNNQLTRSRNSALLATLLLGACGVVEHPHEVQAVDTSDDFGPLGGSATGGVPTVPGTSGSAPTPTAGSVGIGGIFATAGSAAQGGASGSSPTGGAPASAGAGGSPPLSGVTITLGGVNVPKEQAIAFIHVGHSNMAGRATSPQASRPYHFQETHPHAFMYHAGSPPELAIEPKTAGDTAAAGPGTALVKEAATLAPGSYFISLGYGRPSAYCSQFLPSGLYYNNLIAGPKAIKGRVTFGAIFIYLGITERHGSEADRTGFPGCVNALVTAIRNDVGEPNLPVLMNDYEVGGTGEFVVGGEVANAIMPQIAKVPSTVSNSVLVSAAGIGMQDDHHFNLDGHRTWVQRALMTMQQKGWFPWK
jgi:hypothetical protein